MLSFNIKQFTKFVIIVKEPHINVACPIPVEQSITRPFYICFMNVKKQFEAWK